MFSTKALARELTCSPLTNAMSDPIAPGPRRGRSTTPGNSTPRPRSLTRQREPSEAGAASKAVRSAIRAPGKYPATMPQRFLLTMSSEASSRLLV